MRLAWSRHWPVVLLFSLAIAFYWKLTLTDQFVWFDHPDMCYIEIPRLQFQAKEIQNRRFPLWDPYIWAGQPLIGQTQPGPLFPLNLLFYLVPRRGGYIQFAALNWYFVVIHFLAAWCAFALCRDWGRSTGASLVAGCLYGFGGFLGTVAWLDVMNGAIFTPLAFLYLFRAARGTRPWWNASLAGFWVGIAWLSGHHEIPLLVTAVFAVTWIYFALRERKLAPVALVSVLVMLLIGAAQGIPTYEFGKLSMRWVGEDQPVGWNDKVPYTVVAIYSLPFRGLLSFVLPAQDRPADCSAYQGLAGVVLATLGLIAFWKDHRSRWAAAVGAAAVLYALGAFTPLQGALHSLVPGLDKARIPIRAVHLVNFSLAVLAAYGVDALLEGAAERWARRIQWLACAIAAVIFGAALFWAVMPNQQLKESTLITGLAAAALAGTLAMWRNGGIARRSLVLTLAGISLFELYGESTATFANRYDKTRNKFIASLKENHDVADYLRIQSNAAVAAGGNPVRASVADADIPTNFGDWHAVETINGYVAGVPKNLLRVELHTRRTQQLFGVTHSVARKPDWPDQQQVYEGASGVKVWRNPDPMPRVWTVQQTIRVQNDGELRQRLQDPALDFNRAAVVMGDVPALESCADGSAQLIRRSTDRALVKARLNCRGMLILSDPYYPGWKAKVDGAPAPIHEVYGALRGVVLEAGEHTVEFRFRPMSVYLGAFCAIVGLGILLVSARAGARSPTRPPS